MTTLLKLALAAAALAATPAAAVTIDVSGSGNNSGGAALWTDTISFVLPTGFTGASLNITSFVADDRAIAELNGTLVDATGIFGPGNGSFRRVGGENLPFTYTLGNGARDITVTGPFVAGTNQIQFTINDTYAGIGGDTFAGAAGPTNYAFAGTVSYDLAAAVPEPASWAMMIGGIGLAGGSLRRRRVQARVRFA